MEVEVEVEALAMFPDLSWDLFAVFPDLPWNLCLAVK